MKRQKCLIKLELKIKKISKMKKKNLIPVQKIK